MDTVKMDRKKIEEALKEYKTIKGFSFPREDVLLVEFVSSRIPAAIAFTKKLQKAGVPVARRGRFVAIKEHESLYDAIRKREFAPRKVDKEEVVNSLIAQLS